jgi:hypothetical protein
MVLPTHAVVLVSTLTLTFGRAWRRNYGASHTAILSRFQSSSEEADEFEDMLESREMEVQDFEPAPRQTEADVTDDRRSVDRKLDKVLYLLVKKPREKHAWQMPQGGVEGEESLFEVRVPLAPLDIPVQAVECPLPVYSAGC